MKSCSFRTRSCASGEEGSPPRIAPNPAKISIIFRLTSIVSASDLPLAFCSYSRYAGVSPQVSLAFAAYSTIFFVSKAEKSILVFSPVVLIGPLNPLCNLQRNHQFSQVVIGAGKIFGVISVFIKDVSSEVS